MTHGVNVVGDQMYLVSIALQKEANVTLVGTKQVIMLLRNARIKRAILQHKSMSTVFDLWTNSQAGFDQMPEAI